MTMHIANPKSFVAGSLVLVMAVKTMLQSSHVVALHTFNLVLLPVVSALCFWHAFMGRRPLIGKREVGSSIWLGAVSLIPAGGFTFIVLEYRHQAVESFLFAGLFYAAAVFYFHQALQERRANVSQNPG